MSAFGFKGPDQQKPAGVLSGGERNRLNLALTLKEGGNLILLDEPTNDLDVETLSSLENALEKFPGCAVVISHDRWFLDRTCTHILAWEGDEDNEAKWFWFEGNFGGYEENKLATTGRRRSPSAPGDPPHGSRATKCRRAYQRRYAVRQERCDDGESRGVGHRLSTERLSSTVAELGQDHRRGSPGPTSTPTAALTATRRSPTRCVTGPINQSALRAWCSPALLAAHYRLGRHRSFGDTRVAVYAEPTTRPVSVRAADRHRPTRDADGLRHRAAASARGRLRRDHEPGVPGAAQRRAATCSRSSRSPTPAPGDGIDESWIHVQLSPIGRPQGGGRSVKRLLPSVLADARQVALDSPAMIRHAAQPGRRARHRSRGPVPQLRPQDVAALLRWLADGHFVLLGYQRCPVHDGRSSVDRVQPPGGAAAARPTCCRQLTEDDDLLVLAQATMPSFLRYGAYPYIVVVREHAGGQRRSSTASSACSPWPR